MANRTRDIQVKFRVTQEELEFITLKMQQLGTQNREAYLRKMAIDGLVVKLDIPQLKEMIHLLHRAGNNINQIAKQVNTTHSCTPMTTTTYNKAWMPSGTRQTKSCCPWRYSKKSPKERQMLSPSGCIDERIIYEKTRNV